MSMGTAPGPRNIYGTGPMIPGQPLGPGNGAPLPTPSGGGPSLTKKPKPGPGGPGAQAAPKGQVKPNPGGPGAKAVSSGTAPTPAPPAASANAPANSAPAGGQPKPPPGGPNSSPAGSFQNWLNTQFGSNNPFGMGGNYSDPNNPLYAAAQRNLQQALAGTRAQYGASGLGNSSREALAEGNAMGDFGAQIAQIGEASRQSDANRALQAYQAGTSTDLAQNQAQANLGSMLNQIGINEQNLPMLNALMSLFQSFYSGFGTGNQSQQSHTGTGFFGL